MRLDVSFKENDAVFPNVMRDVQILSGQPSGDYAPIDSPAFTGTPTAPTAPIGTRTTQIATTEFCKKEIDLSLMDYGNIVRLSIGEVTS